MPLDFEFTTTARDDLDRLPNEASARLIAKFEDAADWPDHYLNRLSGSPYYLSVLESGAQSLTGIKPE